RRAPGGYASWRCGDRDRTLTTTAQSRCRPSAQSLRSIWWASRTRTGVLRHTDRRTPGRRRRRRSPGVARFPLRRFRTPVVDDSTVFDTVFDLPVHVLVVHAVVVLGP